MKRAWIVGVIAALLFGGALAEDRSLLIRVDRNTTSDLAVLRGAGVPVVMELEACLLVRGGLGDLAALGAQGYRATILDDQAASSTYLVVGLRPDTDQAKVRSLGAVLAEEENWILIRAPRETGVEALQDARAFVTRVPDEPVAIPQPPPATLAPASSGTMKALGGTTTGTPVPIVQKIVAAVSTASIDAAWHDLASNPPTGTRYSTAQGCRDASDYCLDTFTSYGVPAAFQTWSGSHAPNVIATHEGGITPQAVYIVEGHLDDLPSSGAAPGADDNASGTVNVLESARVMACWGFKNTVKFLAVTGEEFGLYGSEAYADDAFARGEQIQGVINMDMIGWAGNGIPAQENLDFNYNAGSQWLAQRFVDAAATYATGLSVNAFLCPSLTASDHYPFWQKGWSAVCGITDNEGYCGQSGNYPYYHTSNDTIANCGNPAFFYSVVKTSVATLAELAEPFKIAFDRPAYGCGVTLRVVVGDRDPNTSPSTRQTVTARVWSDSEPAGETITLTEKTVNSMYFEGTLATTSLPPATGDGLLTVAAGDALHAEYVDALDCDGAPNVTYHAEAGTDCVVPVISGVTETSVTDTAATIIWTTNEASDSVVDWGTIVPPDQTTSNAALVTSHQVNLTGLQSCTVYRYGVRSSDVAGNQVAETNGGQYFHFETLGNFGAGLQPCHEGRVSLDRPAVACSDALPVRLVDMDLNLSSSVADTAIVTVSSTTEPAPELLTLVETGPNTSTFTAAIATAPGAPTAADGVLQVAHGDLVTATYRDGDDGAGSSATTFATGDVDCLGPVITDVRVTDVTDDGVTVRWTTAEPASSRVDWGATPSLGSTVSSSALVMSHALTLKPIAECGRIHFRVSATDGQGNARSVDVAGVPLAANAHHIPGIFRDNFETSTGWTVLGEWQIGAPQGKGTQQPDPTAAYEGTKVLGHDLTGLGTWPGDYEPQISERATSPVINASALVGGKIKFRRWLNVGGGGVAAIEVKRNGVWSTVWTTNSGSTITETAWSLQTIDISSLADGNAQLQIAFKGNGGFASTSHRSGWNVDRFIVKGSDTPDFDACGGCAGAPSFVGASLAEDVGACADSGIRVSWAPATAWGTGRAGTYAIFRDTNPTFTPAAANRIAAGVSGTSYTDASAPNGVALYYIVRAENDETCSSGPANGGVTDDNLVRVTARDDTSEPPLGTLGMMLANGVNRAHVRLTWPSASGAAKYRIYRGPDELGPFTVVGEVAGTLWEDRDEFATGLDRYYFVRAVDACGNQGP